MKKYFLLIAFFVSTSYIFAFKVGDTLVYNVDTYSITDSYTKLGNTKVLIEVVGKLKIKYKLKDGDSILLIGNIEEIKAQTGTPHIGFTGKLPLDSLKGEEFAITLKKGGIYYTPHNPIFRALYDPIIFPIYSYFMAQKDNFKLNQKNQVSHLYMKAKTITKEVEKRRIAFYGDYVENYKKRDARIDGKMKMEFNGDALKDTGRDIPMSGWFGREMLEIVNTPFIGMVTVNSNIYSRFEIED